MMTSNEPYLYVVLGQKPRVFSRTDKIGEALILDGETYALLEREVAFYDFLRNKMKFIIGIRFSFFDKQKMLKEVEKFEYIYANEKGRYLEVYFDGYRSSTISESADQSFGDDAIWRSNTGKYALQVGTTDLTSEELSIFLKAHQDIS